MVSGVWYVCVGSEVYVGVCGNGGGDDGGINVGDDDGGGDDGGINGSDCGGDNGLW